MKASFIFLKGSKLVSSKGKRWNGNVDVLPVTYLKDVMAKMLDYGDRVQFSLVSGGTLPSYQVINHVDKKMAFDRDHHLLQPQTDEFVGANASPIFSLDQIKARIAGVSLSPTATSRSARVVSATNSAPRTNAARLEEQFAAQRYEYFKNNRSSLPADITKHTDEIAALMRLGKSAEEAFAETVKKYF
jgi:hypothetical protein